MPSHSSIELADIQKLLADGKAHEALRALHRNFLPSDDQTVTVVHADVLRAMEQPEAAIRLYRRAALQGGKYAPLLWKRICETQWEAQHIDEALTTVRYALSLTPDNLELHQQAAQLLFSSTLHSQASCHARHILKDSTDDDALAIAENVYRFSMQPYEAYQVVKKRQACAPYPDVYLGLVLCGAQGICEWDTVSHCAHVIDTEYYAKGDFRSVREIPLYNIARIANEAFNLGSAQAATFALEEIAPAFDPAAWMHNSNRKIRVGLLSADFASHPVIQLIIGLFESFDKSRFELFAFDDGKNNADNENRMLQAMDRHIDIREQSDMDVAQKVYAEGIDILIDLMGLTTKNRQGVLALRPCPVTAVFLGFPGTCGLSKIDYVISDAIVTPDSSKPHYAEKLCRLPETFMPNDSKRQIASNPVTRADVGLPEDAVVFCSFNRSFKLDEESVTLWMRILARVPGSVLWQKGHDPEMQEVFLETAARHGIAPERLIFAGNTSSVALHLARAGLADLGLDTLIYNGHTITADMLWAGTPVVTCKGTHFASRVSASLLHAVGLDECITHNVQEMEDLAVALALNPARLKALKAKLARNKSYMPLFDTERYTRHFETAMTMMIERARQGLPPDHIDVPALPPRCAPGEDPLRTAFLPDGPPFVYEERAGTPEDGPYADMAASQVLQKTPYGIHFGTCPICDAPPLGVGIPVTVSGHPTWRESLPQKTFWVHCGHCNHLHANVFWDDEASAVLREAQPQPSFAREDIIQARIEYAPLVEYLWRKLAGPEKPNAVPHWMVCDASNAGLTMAISVFCFQTTTLSLFPALVQELLQYDIPAWHADLITADLSGTVDVISLDAFERRPYPRLMVARAHTLLKPGGFVHIPMTEFNALSWRLEGEEEKNFFLQDPARLHMFTRHELTALLKEEGFTLETILTGTGSVCDLHVLARKSEKKTASL